eukprot:1152327-Pelagomonas_calceolata.AAC.2
MQAADLATRVDRHPLADAEAHARGAAVSLPCTHSGPLCSVSAPQAHHRKPPTQSLDHGTPLPLYSVSSP